LAASVARGSPLSRIPSTGCATVNNTRGVEQKKELFARIAELLAKNPGIRPENILINLLEVHA
jgi:phenylpyruvate tautomerase PptA (4-oxalocrotonate tautomerase family)